MEIYLIQNRKKEIKLSKIINEAKRKQIVAVCLVALKIKQNDNKQFYLCFLCFVHISSCFNYFWPNTVFNSDHSLIHSSALSQLEMQHFKKKSSYSAAAAAATTTSVTEPTLALVLLKYGE